MSKQASITSFTQPKPETPKRKRDNKDSKIRDTVSPSQVSPENKKVQAKVSHEKTKREQTMTTEQQEEVKSKNRGKPTTPEVNRPTQIPLPPSPEGKKEDSSEEQRENCRNDRDDSMGQNVGETKDHTTQERIPEEEQRPKEPPTPMEVDDVEGTSPKDKLLEAEGKVPAKIQRSVTEKQETARDGQSTQTVQDGSAKSNPMNQLTFKAALTKQNTPILPQYKSHRVNVSFAIRSPKNKAKRTEYLAKGLNKFLTSAKKVAPANRTIFVRRFKDNVPLQDTERSAWIDAFGPTNMSQLINYTYGFYANQPLRNGTFRLTLQIVVPITTNMTEFIDNVNGVWGDSASQMVRDSTEQKLWDPKQVGWLLRSTWNMTASSELQDSLEATARAAGFPQVYFGVQWKTIPSPGNKKEAYDKETAIRAVVVSTNAPHVNQAWKILFDTYNSGSPSPNKVDMHFVPTKNHPDIRNNQTAVHNITYLMESQRIFKENTFTEECYSLSNPMAEVRPGVTLRDILMELKSRVMGPKKYGAKLFHSITPRMKDGVTAYFFTYHLALAKEATSVIAGLPSFIATELNLDPVLYCYPTHINKEHQWIADTRMIKNSTVDFLNSLTGNKVFERDEDEDEESYEMDSQCEREFKRTVGLDDAETVVHLADRKASRKKKIPEQVNSDQSVSEMSGLTNYSSASKASQARKEMRNTIDEQRIYMEEQAEAMKEMQERMMQMMQAMQSGGAPVNFTMPNLPPPPPHLVKPSAVEETTKPMLINLPEDKDDMDAQTNGEDEVQIMKVIQPVDSSDERIHNSGPSKDNPVEKEVENEEEYQEYTGESEGDEEEMPIGNTFIDSDGIEWETGSHLSLDNPNSENRDVDESWFELTQGTEMAARAYAMKMYREGHDVIISKTGATSPEKVVVYVIVHESDIQQTQENKSPPGNGKVEFTSTTEVQEYDPRRADLKGEQDVVQMNRQDGKTVKKEYDHRKVTQDEASSEEDESKEDLSSSSSEEQSTSTGTSKSSTQSPGDNESESGTPSSTREVKTTPQKASPATKRVTNLTRDVVAATAKMKKAQAIKAAAPKGKQKSISGQGSGQRK